MAEPLSRSALRGLTRWDMDAVLEWIGQQKYFLLHAPRQTGKTSCLLALMEYLNRAGHYRAAYANLEGAQAMRDRVEAAMATIVTDIGSQAGVWLGDREPERIARTVLAETAPGSALGVFLTRWSQQSPQPLVLLLDEVDALVGVPDQPAVPVAHRLPATPRTVPWCRGSGPGTQPGGSAASPARTKRSTAGTPRRQSREQQHRGRAPVPGVHCFARGRSSIPSHQTEPEAS